MDQQPNWYFMRDSFATVMCENIMTSKDSCFAKNGMRALQISIVHCDVGDTKPTICQNMRSWKLMASKTTHAKLSSYGSATYLGYCN